MNECKTQHSKPSFEFVGFASRVQPTELTNQLADAAAAGIYTHGVKPLDINDAELISNFAHKLAAGLTGCLSAKAKDQSCQAAAVGAIIGEMVGDWMIDADIQDKISSDEKVSKASSCSIMTMQP